MRSIYLRARWLLIVARTFPTGGPVAGRFGFFFFFMNKTSSAARAAGFGGSGLEGPAPAPPAVGGGGPGLEPAAAGLGRPEGPAAGGRGGGVDVGGGGASDIGEDDRMAEDEDMGEGSRLMALGGRCPGTVVGLRLTP